MERSALYRRALAPIMLLAGAMGIATTGIGIFFKMYSVQEFEGLWLCTAVLAVVGAFRIARRQALKDQEAFWSPPTRRVAQALLPPLLAGLCLGLFPVLNGELDDQADLIPVLVWILLYGCALHSAGFFMPRGIKLFGWLFIAGAIALAYAAPRSEWLDNVNLIYWVMGFFFGVLHLAYGAYLYLTEKGKNAA